MRFLFLFVLVLALSWVVAAMTLGGLVAPAVFSLAPPRGELITRETAGAVFGVALMRWLTVGDVMLPVLLLAVLAAGYGLWRQGWKLVAGAILAVAAVHAGSHTIGAMVSREADAVATAARQAGTAAGDDPRFASLHRWSTLLFSVETGAALALVLAAGGVILRPPRGPAS